MGGCDWLIPRAPDPLDVQVRELMERCEERARVIEEQRKTIEKLRADVAALKHAIKEMR